MGGSRGLVTRPRLLRGRVGRIVSAHLEGLHSGPVPNSSSTAFFRFAEPDTTRAQVHYLRRSRGGQKADMRERSRAFSFASSLA